MGVATVTAARILRGQRQGKQGEEHELAWDAFPAVALAKVLDVRNQQNVLIESLIKNLYLAKFLIHLGIDLCSR